MCQGLVMAEMPVNKQAEDFPSPKSRDVGNILSVFTESQNLSQVVNKPHVLHI